MAQVPKRIRLDSVFNWETPDFLKQQLVNDLARGRLTLKLSQAAASRKIQVAILQNALSSKSIENVNSNKSQNEMMFRLFMFNKLLVFIYTCEQSTYVCFYPYSWSGKKVLSGEVTFDSTVSVRKTSFQNLYNRVSLHRDTWTYALNIHNYILECMIICHTVYWIPLNFASISSREGNYIDAFIAMRSSAGSK